jgi:hypothetical protein
MVRLRSSIFAKAVLFREENDSSILVTDLFVCYYILGLENSATTADKLKRLTGTIRSRVL